MYHCECSEAGCELKRLYGGEAGRFGPVADTVGESFEPNVEAAQKAGTLTELAKRMNLAQRSVPKK